MNANLNRWVARFLILSMINPALFVPSVMARDTDVYSGMLSATAASAIQPNILILLDTSDSMNLPEAWKIYPGAYDSHVEYLWNDLTAIVDDVPGGATENTSLTDNARISTAAMPSTFFTKMGFWDGVTPADRQALWQAALSSAKATQTNGAVADPGPAYKYRNYNDLSWIYWLPAGVAETDSRLSSNSWNKFRGYIQELGNGSGGSVLRGGPSFTDTNDYRLYNQCGASLNDLTPSTVFVPSGVARNSGKYLGQQWARWEPYLALTAVNAASYPGSSVLANPGLGGGINQPLGYIDTNNPSTGNPASNPVYRDSYPVVAPTNTPPSVTLGANGLPIRYNGGSAGAGWDDIKADAGGFILRDIVDNFTSLADLDVVKGWYGLPATSDVNSSLSTDLQDAKHIAWKGNRDGTPTFGSMTGVPAYYDQTAATCDSATGPSSATCLDKQSGTTVAPFTLTKTATCNLVGPWTTSETDASGNPGATRRTGGTCTIGTISTSGTDGNGTGTYPSFSDVPSPTVCPSPTTANSSIRTEDYANCTRSTATVTLSAGTTCAFGGATPLTIGGCSVSGASNVSVAACAMTGATPVTVGSCGWSGRSTRTIGSCAWSGRTATYTEGVGWKASGGSCQESGSATYCAGVADTSTYPTEAAALAATASCTNTTTPGTYNYGGTCTENGSASSCQITGGTTIPGLGLSNATCSNSLAAGTYNYGGSCTENGSPSSCNAASGGTSLTIRGNTQVYNRSCSGNKANSGTTMNAVGSYAYGGTCASSQNNNVCSGGTGTAFTVRGASYTPTTCSATLPTGTFYQGGSCSGTNVPCAVVNPYGGTSVTSGGSTWYSTRPTCTAPTGASTQSYFNNCTGRMRKMPATGSSAQTSPTQLACNFTTSTVNIGGTNYTNYTSCTDKPDVNSDCMTRYGVQCSTSCGAATPTSLSFAGTSTAHNYYRTYNFAAKTDYLVHECKADETANNPGGNTYLRKLSGSLAPMATAFNNNVSASIASNVAAYSTSSAQAVTTDATKQVDMYSVNYLNWKFGPKAPDASGVLQPIGRKTRLQIAKDAFSNVLGAVNNVRIGLMAFNQMEKVSYDSSGAHLVKAVMDLGDLTNAADPNLANRTALINSINALTASSATPLTESLYEANRYFRGDSPWYGGTASGTNYPATESVVSTPSNLRYVTEGADTSANAIVSGKYKSPITTCQNNMVILVSDGAPENDWSANSQVLALPTVNNSMGTPISINQGTPSGQFETSGLPYGPLDVASTAASPGNYILLDELAYYMANADARSDLTGEQLVKLSTVKYGVSSPVLDQAALVGGGSSFMASNETTLYNAIVGAINSVSQWQPVGSMPAMSFNKTTGATDDVYMSAFWPSGSVTWGGTIKKYRSKSGASYCGSASCGSGNPDLCLTGNPTVSYGSCGINVEYPDNDPILGITTLKIRNAAVSYWIPTTAPDGGSGILGGTGQVLINKGLIVPGVPPVTPVTRKLYTYLTGVATTTDLTDSSNALQDTNTAITGALLGNATMTPAQRTALIGFAQGSDGTTLNAWRSWAHYDSVHPAPLLDVRSGSATALTSFSYLDSLGVSQTSQVTSVLYYVTSDGVVHATDADTGVELWAFMVEEGLPRIADSKDNLVGTHLEVADGTPVQVKTADGRDLLVFGMRRGGRAYYALNVTNVSKPEFAWKITPTEICNSSCTADVSYGELGQAWSTPAVGLIRGYKDSSVPAKFKPVLVFGGGYDPNQDLTIPGNDSMGRAVFVADAGDGHLIKAFSTLIGAQGYSVPADVAAIDATGDFAGTIDRVYVGDMGGNLWRMDLDDMSVANSPANWTIVRLAKLSTATRPNKLFNTPAIAPAVFKGQSFDAVFIGGGDLQQPSAKGASDSGAFFLVKDMTIAGVAAQPVPVPDAASSGDFIDMTSKVNADLTVVNAVTGKSLNDDLVSAKGGYVVNLNNGEKVSSAATIINGTVYFGTYFPQQTAATALCQLGGYGNQYYMDALTGTPVITNFMAGLGARVYANVGGFGRKVDILSGGYNTPKFHVGSPASGMSARPDSIPNTRTFWYSVPER